MPEIQKEGGFTVDELIEALQKLPPEVRSKLVSHEDDCRSFTVTRINFWDDGVELS